MLFPGFEVEDAGYLAPSEDGSNIEIKKPFDLKINNIELYNI